MVLREKNLTTPVLYNRALQIRQGCKSSDVKNRFSFSQKVIGSCVSKCFTICRLCVETVSRVSIKHFGKAK